MISAVLCFAERQVDLRVGGWNLEEHALYNLWMGGYDNLVVVYNVIWGGGSQKWSSLRYIICPQPPNWAS